MRIAIYQMNTNLPEYEDLFGKNYDTVSKVLKNLRRTIKQYYKLIYVDERYYPHKSYFEILDELYCEFNEEEKPESYRGHSLSISDIVVLNGVLYYCDDYTWVEIKY